MVELESKYVELHWSIGRPRLIIILFFVRLFLGEGGMIAGMISVFFYHSDFLLTIGVLSFFLGIAIALIGSRISEGGSHASTGG